MSFQIALFFFDRGPMKDRIFFRDKANVLKGPFTEHQVQEWYREKWFESAFPFYFVKGGELPADDTASFTLDELCSLNGVGCPFKWTEGVETRGDEQERRRIEERIEGIDQGLEELRSRIASLISIEPRLDRLEEMLKEDARKQLASDEPDTRIEPEPQSDPAPEIEPEPPVRPQENTEPPIDRKENPATEEDVSTSTPVNAQQDSPAERGFPSSCAAGCSRAPLALDASAANIPKATADATLAFINSLVDAHKNVLTSRSWTYCPNLVFDWFIRLVDAYVDTLKDGGSTLQDRFPEIPSMQIFLGWLDREIGDGQFEYPFYCSVCRIVSFNFIQAARHITHSSHWNRVVDETYKGIGATLYLCSRYFFEIWDTAECKTKNAVARKYDKVRVERDEMRPSREFLESLNEAHSSDLFSTEGSEAAVIEAACGLVEGSIGKKIQNKLRRHIGDHLTYCDTCHCIVGKGDEYYLHLLTYEHLVNTPHRDIPTLVVNVLKAQLLLDVVEETTVLFDDGYY